MRWHCLNLVTSPVCPCAVVGAPLGLLPINWCSVLDLSSFFPARGKAAPLPTPVLLAKTQLQYFKLCLGRCLFLGGSQKIWVGHASSLSPSDFPSLAAPTAPSRRGDLHHIPFLPIFTHLRPPRGPLHPLSPLPLCSMERTRRPGDGRSTSQVQGGTTGGL